MDAASFPKCIFHLDRESNDLLLKSPTDYETIFYNLRCVNVNNNEELDLSSIERIQEHPFSPHLALISKKAIWVSVNLQHIMDSVPKIVTKLHNQYPKNDLIKFESLKLESINKNMRLHYVEWMDDDYLSLLILYNEKYLGIVDVDHNTLKCFVDVSLNLKNSHLNLNIGHNNQMSVDRGNPYISEKIVLDACVINYPVFSNSNNHGINQTFVIFVLCNRGIILPFIYSKAKYNDKCCLNFFGASKKYGCKKRDVLRSAYKIFSIPSEPPLIGILTKKYTLCTFILNLEQSIVQNVNNKRRVKLYLLEVIDLTSRITTSVTNDEGSNGSFKESPEDSNTINYAKCPFSVRFDGLPVSVNERESLNLLTDSDVKLNESVDKIYATLRDCVKSEITTNLSKSVETTDTNNDNTTVPGIQNKSTLSLPSSNHADTTETNNKNTVDFDPQKLKLISKLLKECNLNANQSVCKDISSVKNFETERLKDHIDITNSVYIKMNKFNNSSIFVYSKNIVIEIKLYCLHVLIYCHNNNIPLSVEQLKQSEVVELYSIPTKLDKIINTDLINGLIFTNNPYSPVCIFSKNSHHQLHLKITNTQVIHFMNKLNHELPQLITQNSLCDISRIYTEAFAILDYLKPKLNLVDIEENDMKNLSQMNVLLDVLRKYTVYMNQYVFVISNVEELYLVFLKNMQQEILKYKTKFNNILNEASTFADTDSSRIIMLDGNDEKMQQIQINKLNHISQSPYTNSQDIKYYTDKISQIKHYVTYINCLKKKILDIQKQLVKVNENNDTNLIMKAVNLNNQLCFENYKEDLKNIKDNFKKEQRYASVMEKKVEMLTKQMKYLHNGLGK